MSSSSRRVLALALVVPLIGIAGCVSGYTPDSPTAPSGCPTNVVPALAIEVRDSVTQAAIASGVHISGMVVGQRGTYALTTPVDQDSLTINFGTISGTYSFALHRSGYQDVSRTGVVVQPADSLDCHPNTVSLAIRMQPTS